MQLGDARKLDQRTQEALRVRAVFLVEKGATHMEAALAVGVHRGTVSRWCGAFRRNGTSGIEKGKRGRRAGDQLILTEVEARRVQRWIRDKMPDQMQLPSRCGRRKRCGRLCKPSMSRAARSGSLRHDPTQVIRKCIMLNQFTTNIPCKQMT